MDGSRVRGCGGAREAAQLAKEIQIRAERKAGEFLDQAEKSKGGRPPKNMAQVEPRSEYQQTLEETGVPRSTAKRWQTVARMPHVEKAVILFDGAKHLTIKKDDTVYVALRPLARAIGVMPQALMRIIENDPVLNSTVDVTSMVARDGKNRHFYVLPLDFLPGLLFKIPASRYEGAFRERLIKYQRPRVRRQGGQCVVLLTHGGHIDIWRSYVFCVTVDRNITCSCAIRYGEWPDFSP